jgi:hypothetical protein
MIKFITKNSHIAQECNLAGENAGYNQREERRSYHFQQVAHILLADHIRGFVGACDHLLFAIQSTIPLECA